MRSDLLRVFDGSPILKVSRDTSRSERMRRDLFLDSRRDRPAPNHFINIKPAHRFRVERATATAGAAEKRRGLFFGDSDEPEPRDIFRLSREDKSQSALPQEK